MAEPITVMIPTWRRTARLLDTLEKIRACRPEPAATWIHVDAGDSETESAVKSRYGKAVGVVSSPVTVGPGGGRQRLLPEVQTPFFASFDDDSWPLNGDFFGRAAALMKAQPKTAVLSAIVCMPTEANPPTLQVDVSVSCYAGGAHVGRTKAFQSIVGYVPLRYAYGMEEADVALQLMDKGWDLKENGILKVWHDSALEHHADAGLNAAQIANTALRAFLRYPASWWPRGILQVANRVRYALSVGRWRGTAAGIASIPGHCWKYRQYRAPVTAATLTKAVALGSGRRES